jgi:ABC-2 type transport system ATP-binding protein
MTVRENLDMGAYGRKDRDEVKKDLDRVFDLFPRMAERIGQKGGTMSGGEQQMLAIGRALMSRPRVLLLDEPSMGLPMSRVDEMLELVSLDETESRRRIRNYSLGMRQRLGIAHALLGDPSVLILDEPANGLDPAGIRWMRGLLKGYADRGGTVLLSSHLLHEVEQIADEMLLIGRGKIVARGSKAELLANAGGAGTLVTALDHDQLTGALTDRGLSFVPVADGIRVDAQPVDVGRIAAESSIVLTELRTASGGLEDLFLELTADTQRDDVSAAPAPEGASL